MSSRLQISDFIGEYPEIDISVPTEESTFNTQIARKAEFRELRSTLNEPIPKRGQGFAHQKFAVRYLTWYDRLMLVHDPGTGKSCIIAHSAELFKNEYFKDPSDPTRIRQAVILLRGDALKENIRNEIVCKCTDGIYETERVVNSLTTKAMKTNLTDELNTWYDITTYEVFANRMKEYKREEDIEEYMSNRVFYVDEAQNVTSTADITNKRPPPRTIAEARNIPKRRGKRGETTYETIWRMFHSGNRNKVVLASATPMGNTPNDIVPLINLILPVDHQMPFSSPMTFANQKEFAEQPFEFFEPYFRGRVSYVRASVVGVVDDPQGIKPEGMDIYITPCPMSPFQYSVYFPTMPSSDNKVTQDFYRDSRYASNFVFPDRTYGNQGFDRYVESTSQGYRFKDTDEAQQLRSEVGNPEALSKYSEKYAKILELCLDSWPSPTITETKGIVFIYFPAFVRGSGAAMLSLCLEAAGYEIFRETSSMFRQPTKGRGKRKGPCTNEDEGRVARGRKAKRAALLTNETPASVIHAIFSTVNAYENRYGEYLQVLIGSETAKEGINVNNAVKMIMASSGWNFSSNTQARNRVFRANSLAARRDQKHKAMSIETFNMASTYQFDPDMKEDIEALVKEYDISNTVKTALFESNSSTIDTSLYKLSENKGRLNKHVLRYMKRASVDCFLNRERNIPPPSLDGTATCDYQLCDYECSGIDPTTIDKLKYTTKMLHYAQPDIDVASTLIGEIFSQVNAITLDDLHFQLEEDVDPVYIDLAISKLIRESVPLIDRFGESGVLRTDDHIVYIEKDPFEMLPRPAETVYTSTLLGVQNQYNNTFEDYVVERNVLDEKEIRQSLTSGEVTSFFKTLNGLSLPSKVLLLEKSLLRLIKNESNENIRKIIDVFNGDIFEIQEPVDALDKTASRVRNRGKHRGRKPNPNTQPTEKHIDVTKIFETLSYDPAMSSEKVVLHTLYNQGDHDRSNYGAINRYRKVKGRIRILKMSEGVGWRDLDVHETLVYTHLIQLKIQSILAYFSKFDIYGIVLPPDRKLHLWDASKANSATKDERTVYEGRVCETWDKRDLIDILWRLNVPGNPVPKNTTTKTMKKTLGDIDGFSKKKLRYFYSWIRTKRRRICDVLYNTLKQMGQLHTGRTNIDVQESSTHSIQTSAPMTEPDYTHPHRDKRAPAAVLPDFSESQEKSGRSRDIDRTPVDPQFTVPQMKSENVDFPNRARLSSPRMISSNVGPRAAMETTSQAAAMEERSQEKPGVEEAHGR